MQTLEILRIFFMTSYSVISRDIEVFYLFIYILLIFKIRYMVKEFSVDFNNSERKFCEQSKEQRILGTQNITYISPMDKMPVS